MGLLCSERGGGTENGKAHAVGVEREKAGHPVIPISAKEETAF